MKALLYVPPFNIRRCFRACDLERLTGAGIDLHVASGDTPQELEDWFGSHAMGTDVLLTGWGTPRLREDQLAQCPALKAIIHSAGSVKSLIPPSAWTRGIRVASCNEALAIGVAETTLGMMIAGLKGLFYSREWTRQGGWSDPSFGRSQPSVRELFGLKVGIISASKVGQHLLKLLRNFELEVFLYDPFISGSRAAELGARLSTLGQLCSECDVITIHAPALPETRHLVNGDLIRSIKDNAILINTARGNILDQAALLQELEKDRFTAFLDVTDPEPVPADHPLRRLPNVVLTSHLSGAVSNGCYRQGRSAVEQTLAVLAGQPMSGEIPREALARIA